MLFLIINLMFYVEIKQLSLDPLLSLNLLLLNFKLLKVWYYCTIILWKIDYILT